MCCPNQANTTNYKINKYEFFIIVLEIENSNKVIEKKTTNQTKINKTIHNQKTY